MIIYFIKTILCALFFLFIYIVLFEREKMHRCKRHYLLCSLVLSFVIPFVSLNSTVPQLNKVINRLNTKIGLIERIPDQVSILTNGLNTGSKRIDILPEQPIPSTDTYVEDNIPAARNVDYAFMAKALYVIVMLALLLRLSHNMFRLLSNVKKGKRIVYNKKKLVLIKENLVPFSFGSYIYINEADYTNGLIADEMIRHEQAHIEQRHSLDIIFIELLIVFCWFNPVLYLYRRKIKQNHEFQADEAVLKKDNNVTRYQNILISIISKSGSTGLASSFNYSTIKKRFIMMKKVTSQRKARCRKTLLLPALLLAICMFSAHTIAIEPPMILPTSTDENKVAEEEFIIPGKGVSDELLKEYQDIVNKYLEVDTGKEIKWKTMDLSEEDLQRLYIIHVQMNEEQRKKQLINPIGFFNHTRHYNLGRRYPNVDEWNYAKRAEILWFNGKKADASELEKLTRKDIYFFFNRYYYDNEKKVRQSALWTKSGYEEYKEQYNEKVPLSVLLEIKPQPWMMTGWK